MKPRESTRFADEPFFHPLIIASLAIFAANNWWWKFAFHNAVTGKLSDICFCFFAPVYGALILRWITPFNLRVRLTFGTLITIILFTAVKTSTWFSAALHEKIAPLTIALFGSASHNIVDKNDLIALPMSILAWWYFSKRRC